MSTEQVRTEKPPAAPGSGEATSSAVPTKRPAGRWWDLATKYSLLVALIATFIGFSIALPDRFPTHANIVSVLSNQVVILVIAIGTLFPLAVGEFDLSIGNMVGFTQVLVIGLMSKSNVSIPLAIIIAIGVAGFAGLVNGLLLTKLRASSLIATLATGSVLSGLAFWYSGGQTLYKNIPESFPKLARTTFHSIPLPVIYVTVIAGIVGVVLTFTRAGRRLYATGGNPKAAALTGIRVHRVTILAFVVAGLMAGIAGVIIASQLGSGDPSLGPDLLLPAYAGSFLGATAFRPGRFNVPGTVVAIYFLAVASTGLQIYGVPSWSTDVFNGVALALAVGLSTKAADFRAGQARRSQLRKLERGDETAVATPRPGPA